MRLRWIAFVVVAAALASCGSDDDADSTGGATETADPTAPGGEAAAEPRAAVSATLSAVLAAKPGGDANGSGIAYVGVTAERPEVCFDVRVANVAALTSIVLGRGPATGAGAASTPVAELAPPQLSADGRGCAAAEEADIEQLRTAPAEFYVEVGTAEFPTGAVRGQLGGG